MEWVIKPLGELVTFERGLTYSKSDEAEFSSNGVLRSNNVDLETNSLNLDEIKYLKADFVIPSSKKVVRNSLLMCMSNGSKSHLGKVALIEDDLGYAFGGFMGLLKPIDTVVLPRYLYYSLISPAYKKHIQSLSDGANINNLKYKDLSVFPVMLPTSLSEQQRIVDILDAEFAKIDALKENAEKNLQNAKDLFQAVLRKELEPKDGWTTSKFVDVVRIINGRAYNKSELLSQGKYQVLRVGNFFTNDSWYYSDLELDPDKYCDKGDLLYAWSASFGPKIWMGEKTIYHYHIWKLDHSEVLNRKYLYHWLQSRYLTSQVMSNLHGTTMAHITKGIMESTNIAYPSYDEQCRIADVIDHIFEKCNTLLENYNTTFKLCDDLKQASLRKAFNGEL